MKVSEVFSFSDGRIVLVGEVGDKEKLRLPCKAELFVGGEFRGTLDVVAERMPGPALPRDHKAIEVTGLPIGPELIKSGEAMLNFMSP